MPDEEDFQTWLYDVMRVEPDDSLDRSQFEEIVRVLGDRMATWPRNVDLDDAVEANCASPLVRHER